MSSLLGCQAEPTLLLVECYIETFLMNVSLTLLGKPIPRFWLCGGLDASSSQDVTACENP